MKAMGCFKGVEFRATNSEEVADIRRWIGAGVEVHEVQNLARGEWKPAAVAEACR